ncbi:hypothetical protein [Dokdonia sp. Hel_I_53]|uniref:hypothetical protein n=1 Tax=Dokdonia sp. Hel_I_53 TaxID=1566287 RepID=UPI00119A0072|nr:hypothetical protein [Dokdonia sp. Hel_I_53]TVZ51530.1 hypothetical protein OD90_0675 [Dokdonia sp. Hel_I_53]
MKKIFYTAAFALLTVGVAQAQEKIEKTETVRTTVKSSLGNETVYKTTKETQLTPVKIAPGQEGQENQVQERGRTLVMREVTYTYNDTDFMLEENDNGYTIMRTRENDKSQYGTMRRLSKGDTYLTKTADGISVSYFDENGNMISEKYNDEDDIVTTVTYKMKPTKMSSMKDMKAQKMKAMKEKKKMKSKNKDTEKY